MSLIEGVGDEVTDFFIVLGILLIAWFAWCSTNIADQPLIRTVLILHHRTRTRIAELRANQNTNALSQQQNVEMSEEDSMELNNTESNDAEASCSETSTTDPSTTMTQQVPTNPSSSEEVLLQAMDSFNNDEMGTNNKTIEKNSSEKSSKAESTSLNTTESTKQNLSTASENEISITLKFINDDQKVVTASLKEMLGDFKRRHFQMELDSQKLVRLVFMGQVLQPDNQTLERCGLYDHCVVHCLVHQPRPATTQPSRSHALDDSPIYLNPQAFQDLPAGSGISSVHNEWDLSRLLVSILTLILGLAWYSRYHYAQLFTATTTLSLYMLTAVFTVSLFSNFFPDQDSIRNIE